jgi:hypothetical protein
MKARYQLTQLLQDLIVPLEGGLVRYAPGWDDTRVAEKISAETGVHFTLTNVQNTRQRIFGRLYGKAPAPKDNNKDNALKLLEKRLEILEKRVERMAQLELSLS